MGAEAGSAWKRKVYMFMPERCVKCVDVTQERLEEQVWVFNVIIEARAEPGCKW